MSSDSGETYAYQRYMAEMRAIARQLNDPTISHEDKERLIRPLLMRREDGQVGVPAELVAAVALESEGGAT